MTPSLRRLSTVSFAAALALGAAALSPAQIEDLDSQDPKTRKKAAAKIGDKTGGDDRLLCAELGKLVRDPVPDVRSEVLTSLTKLHSPHCVDALIQATKDASPEIQSMAVDGLVDFYVPDYVNFGFFNSIKDFGGDLRDRFGDPEPVVVERYVEVRPDVIAAIAPLITGGSSLESRANAARAAGILRGVEAQPQLLEALKSRDETIIEEAINALRKLGNPAVGPQIVPYLRDPDKDVKVAAIETVGHLRTQEAVGDLVSLVGSNDKDVRRAALIALAKIPDNAQEQLFLRYLDDKDEEMRAAAAEGLGRAGNEAHLETVQDVFAAEKKETARLSLAFAAAHLGDLNSVQYLIDGLDSTFHRGEARAFLIELARDERVLAELYTPLATGTRDQKIELARVIAHSGDEDSVAHLDRLTQDPDPKVAAEAVTQLRNLQARL